MIKIEVKSDAVRTKSGTSAKTGKPYSIREQEAYAFITDREGKPQPYPAKIVVSLGDDQAPYPPGDYLLSPASLWVNRFQQLELSVQLLPARPTAARAAA